MWPERTHKIRRTPLASKSVLHPVFPRSSLSLSICCSLAYILSSSFSFFLYQPLYQHLCPLHLSLSLFRSPKKPTLAADRPRGWHCGPLDGSRPQTDTKSTATFVFARLYRRRKSDHEMHRLGIAVTWFIRHEHVIRDNEPAHSYRSMTHA